jgi:hypothetical protein
MDSITQDFYRPTCNENLAQQLWGIRDKSEYGNRLLVGG